MNGDLAGSRGDGVKQWIDRSVSMRSLWPYVAGAALAVILAGVGYSSYLPDATPADAVFHALNLLTLSFRVVEGAAVPWTLQVARFLVHFVAAAALWVTVTTLLRRQVDRRRAAGWGEHVAVLGGSATAIDLAATYHGTTKKVVLVGAVSEDDQERLRRLKVRVVTAPDQAALRAIVKGASRVIVAGAGDDDTVRLATQLLASPDQPGCPTHLLVQQPELAGELRSSMPDLVDVCCVAERVASTVLQDFPPRHDDALGPGPVVIGGGDLAVELARRIVRGWYRPADPMHVLCLGPQPSEFLDLREELVSVGRIEVAPGPWSPRMVLEQVVAHALGHRPTDADLERRDEHGPLVVLAGLDDATTFTLATKVAGKVAGATIVALVDRVEGWTDLAEGASGSQHAQGATVHMRSARSMVSKPAVLETDRVRLLAQELFFDQWRWRDDVPSVFGDDVRAAADFGALSPAQRDRFEAVAAAVPGAFREQGFRVESTDQPQVVLLPEELIAIGSYLRRAAEPGGGSEADDYLWLEFVAKLPMLASRAGVDLVRSVVPSVEITDADLEVMARAAHEAYVETQAAAGNLTGSELAERAWDQLSEFAKESNRAQARDIPVKLAGVGRTLCRLGEGEPDRSWLSEEAVQRLAIWEHRRWEYLHRLAGYTYADVTDHAARRHSMLVPWNELATVETLDRSAVVAIPDLLAGVGLDTRPLDHDRRWRQGALS